MATKGFPQILGWNEHEMRLDADGRADGQPVYQYFAAPGTATSAEQWTGYKYTYSGSNMTRRELKFKVAWDNRTTEF